MIAQYEDVNSISIRATKIVSSDQLVVREELPFALFPSLNFTCERGRIIRLWFIGRFSEGSAVTTGTSDISLPIFRLWTINRSKSFNDDLVLSAIPTTQLIPVEPLEGTSFNFTKGDFIGIMNPNVTRDRFSLLYYNNSGPSVYFQTTAIFQLISSSKHTNVYPLLAVETGKSLHNYHARYTTSLFLSSEPHNCAAGFLSQAILQSLMRNIIAYPQPGLYIIPALSFACSGGDSNVEVIVGGELKKTVINAGARKMSPLMITWWQQNETDQMYTLADAANITELRAIDGHPNTYSFRLRFDTTAGNVLGIRLNTGIFMLYYDSSRVEIVNHRIRFEPGSIQVVLPDSTIHGAPLFSFVDTGNSITCMVSINEMSSLLL